MKLRTTGLALLAVSALAAGCGGDDEQEALAKPDFVKQANAICTKFESSVEKSAEAAFAGLESEKDLTPEIAREFFDDALPRFDQAVEDLDGLGAPEGDEDEVQAIVDAGKSDSQKIADAKDGEEIESFVLEDSATPEFDKKAEAYGLTDCGS